MIFHIPLGEWEGGQVVSPFTVHHALRTYVIIPGFSASTADNQGNETVEEAYQHIILGHSLPLERMFIIWRY